MLHFTRESLERFWEHIIGRISTKVDKVEGMGLSSNDYTTDEKSKVSTAYTHASSTHARTDATKVESSSTNGNIKINGTETKVYTHPTGTNPHGTTKADLGLGNVNNTSDANKPISTATQTALNNKVDKVSGKGLSTNDYTTTEKNKLSGIEAGANKTVVDTELSNTSENPVQNKVIHSKLSAKANANHTHSIATSSALGFVKSGGDITIDSNGIMSVADDSHNHIIGNVDGLQSALDLKLNTSQKGANNGLAELDSNGRVPSSQLPSYVDDVINGTLASSTSFKDSNGAVVTGETGKIYIDTLTNKTYRWNGVDTYVEISASLALGETDSTAYRGDRGKIAYEHSQITSGNPHGITPSSIGAAATSHGTHVTYSSTAPVMDGTASAGSASAVARSDHKHPTDTSRLQANFGAANAGKVLVVADDGSIVLKSVDELITWGTF